VEFALMYGIYAKARGHFKVIDLSYRKSLKEWMRLVNSHYPHDSKINSSPGTNRDSNLVNGNMKQVPFPKLKTGNNNSIQTFIPTPFFKGQSYAGSRGGFSTLNKTCSDNYKTGNFKNLKIPQNTIPFPV
jgi:hypothetical protein